MLYFAPFCHMPVVLAQLCFMRDIYGLQPADASSFDGFTHTGCCCVHTGAFRQDVCERGMPSIKMFCKRGMGTLTNWCQQFDGFTHTGCCCVHTCAFHQDVLWERYRDFTSWCQQFDWCSYTGCSCVCVPSTKISQLVGDLCSKVSKPHGWLVGVASSWSHWRQTCF